MDAFSTLKLMVVTFLLTDSNRPHPAPFPKILIFATIISSVNPIVTSFFQDPESS